jgi:hypothetical protein
MGRHHVATPLIHRHHQGDMTSDDLLLLLLFKVDPPFCVVAPPHQVRLDPY